MKSRLEGGKEPVQAKISERFNVRLILHVLKFVNPVSIEGERDAPHDSWVITSKEVFHCICCEYGNDGSERKSFIREENVDSSCSLTILIA